MIIDYELFKGFERTIGDALIAGLALGEDQLKDHCVAFLLKDPGVVERRQTLSRDYERFEKALEEIHNIPSLSLLLDCDSEASMRPQTPESTRSNILSGYVNGEEVVEEEIGDHVSEVAPSVVQVFDCGLRLDPSMGSFTVI